MGFYALVVDYKADYVIPFSTIIRSTLYIYQ